MHSTQRNNTCFASIYSSSRTAISIGTVHHSSNTRNSAIAYKPPDACARHAVLSRADLWWMTAIYWPDFPTVTNLFSIWHPQWGGPPRAIGFILGIGKLEWLGYNLVKVAWWSTQSFGDNTSTWQTHRQPRRHSKCNANTLRRAAKIIQMPRKHFLFVGWIGMKIAWQTSTSVNGRLMMALLHVVCCCQVWLALADNYLNGLCIDWEKTKTLAFNRKTNPDDSKLDLQIVKVRRVLLQRLHETENSCTICRASKQPLFADIFVLSFVSPCGFRELE